MHTIKPIQKMVFVNNKGWVGKTTLSYNVACKIADKWYKVLLVDADPQCNLTLLALWAIQYEELGLFYKDTIYEVFSPIIEGIGDIKIIPPRPLRQNLDIIPGHLNFWDFDDILTSGYADIVGTTSYKRWFMITSAFQRYIHEVSVKNWYELVIIDVSPSMTGSLNKNILLSSDFFATICRPDLFSKQGIINLKEKIIKWKRERENLTLVAKRNSDVPFGNVIADRLTYIGYIINDYNVYGGKIINDHDNVVQGILPELAKLSIELSRNGLMEISKESPLWITQDYGRIWAISQEQHKPMYECTESDVKWQGGSIDLLNKCKIETENLAEECISRIAQRWN